MAARSCSACSARSTTSCGPISKCGKGHQRPRARHDTALGGGPRAGLAGTEAGGGTGGGAIAGLLAAASFYAFYPCWDTSGPSSRPGCCCGCSSARSRRGCGTRRWPADRSARGLTAAVLSGGAFYLVSGMWTDHSAPPNYLRNVASWTFAFSRGLRRCYGHSAAERCHREQSVLFRSLRQCTPTDQRLDLLQMIDVVARVELDQVPDGLLPTLRVQAMMRVA